MDEYDDDYYGDFGDEYDEEPCGSCDECECDLYEDDVYFDGAGFQYCGQCWWSITGGTGVL